MVIYNETGGSSMKDITIYCIWQNSFGETFTFRLKNSYLWEHLHSGMLVDIFLINKDIVCGKGFVTDGKIVITIKVFPLNVLL